LCGTKSAAQPHQLAGEAEIICSRTTYRQEKKITTEVSVHHLWFSDKDYERLGMLIKWNPAIKQNNKEGLLKALLDDRIDIITTDHAPHTLEEKENPIYVRRPDGSALAQLHVRVL
jgi:dihydroorotase